MFTNEVKYLEASIKESKHQHKLLLRITKKLLRYLMEYELKYSSSDWRSIYGTKLQSELIKGSDHSNHSKENVDRALKAILPNMPKDNEFLK